MSQPGYPPSSGAGERWAVNMPAVIGVVFVFLVAVIVWVINSSGGDGDGSATIGSGSTTTLTPGALVTTTLAGATTTVTTTPSPMPSSTVSTAAPDTSATPTSAAPTTTSPTGTPATTATTAPPATVAAPATTSAPDPVGPDGDLGIDGVDIARPPCDDTYITIIASAIGGQATAGSVEGVLDTYDGSNYLRTDRTCPSLNPSANGEPIYVVYFGPYGDDAEACAARARGTEDAYVRRLSNSLGPDHSVSCD